MTDEVTVDVNMTPEDMLRFETQAEAIHLLTDEFCSLIIARELQIKNAR